MIIYRQIELCGSATLQDDFILQDGLDLLKDFQIPQKKLHSGQAVESEFFQTRHKNITIKAHSIMDQGIVVKIHLWVSLSQVIDKFHGSVRDGSVLHDIPDILLDISA